MPFFCCKVFLHPFISKNTSLSCLKYNSISGLKINPVIKIEDRNKLMVKTSHWNPLFLAQVAATVCSETELQRISNILPIFCLSSIIP